MDREMDRERAIGILSACPFFQKLVANDETLLERLAEVAHYSHADAGDVLFRQGDPGLNCYIVLDGKVGVYLHKPKESAGRPTPRKRYDLRYFTTLHEDRKSKAKEQDDATDNGKSMQRYRWITHEGFSTFSENSALGECVVVLGAGSLFGELALMNNAPRAASMKVIEECQMLMIGKEQFQSVHYDILQASEAQVIDELCKELQERCGSVVRAWRTVLDPNAVGTLLFSEFLEALSSLSWQGNTSALWGALTRRAYGNNRDSVVGLSELSPEDARTVDRFKFWVNNQFDGAIQMFNVLTFNRPNASLSKKDFWQACRSYEYPDQLGLIWEVLDVDNAGSICLKDMAYLEFDGLKRKAAFEPGFMMDLQDAKSVAMSSKHRARLQKQSQVAAFSEFKRKLRAASQGSFIRGFRRILDRHGTLTISKVDMLKGCRQVAFSGDVMALWKAMDEDGDGFVQLPELDVRMALVLAGFKRWCFQNHGSCVEAMQHVASLVKKRTLKWNVEEFVGALCLSSWQVEDVSIKQAAAMLHEAADLTGRRHIIAQDFTFLDTWEPTPWLCAEPDFENKDHLMSMLKSRSHNLIVAWRRLFDRHNKNHITFKDFSNACSQVQLKNAPGVWRVLDTEHVGFISLKNVDKNAAQVLLNFKTWAEETFGSIRFAFRVFDSTNKNSVSLPVFKRVLSDFGFPGDARVLFESLRPGSGSRDVRLRLEDMMHLASWETDWEGLDGHSDAEDKSNGEEEQVPEAEGKFKFELPDGFKKSSGFQTMEVSPTPTETYTSAGKSRGSTTTSEFLSFCKSPNEFDCFNQVRMSTSSRYMKKSYSLADSLRKVASDPSILSEGKKQFRPSSPYKASYLPPARPPSSRPVSRSLGRPASRPLSQSLSQSLSPTSRPISAVSLSGTAAKTQSRPISALSSSGVAAMPQPLASTDLGNSVSLPAIVERRSPSNGSLALDHVDNQVIV